jgi:hypothetical protein
MVSGRLMNMWRAPRSDICLVAKNTSPLRDRFRDNILITPFIYARSGDHEELLGAASVLAHCDC